eukprot:5059612-Prymnesium_polylepis.1
MPAAAAAVDAAVKAARGWHAPRVQTSRAAMRAAAMRAAAMRAAATARVVAAVAAAARAWAAVGSGASSVRMTASTWRRPSRSRCSSRRLGRCAPRPRKRPRPLSHPLSRTP